MIGLVWLACAHGPVPAVGSEGRVGVTYEIDGQAADAEAWARALARLSGPELGWSCSETTDGGVVSYWRRRGAGYVFVEEVSAGDRTEYALREVPASEVPDPLRGGG